MNNRLGIFRARDGGLLDHPNYFYSCLLLVRFVILLKPLKAIRHSLKLLPGHKSELGQYSKVQSKGQIACRTFTCTKKGIESPHATNLFLLRREDKYLAKNRHFFSAWQHIYTDRGHASIREVTTVRPRYHCLSFQITHAINS